MRRASKGFKESVGVLWTREVRVKRGIREQGMNKWISEGRSTFSTTEEWRWGEDNTMWEIIGSEALVAAFLWMQKTGTGRGGRLWEKLLDDATELVEDIRPEIVLSLSPGAITEMKSQTLPHPTLYLTEEASKCLSKS